MNGICMAYAWNVEYAWGMHGNSSFCQSSRSESQLFATPSHEITSSLQHSGPKTEPRKIPLEQLCFSVFFFRGVYAACTRRLRATYPRSRQY